MKIIDLHCDTFYRIMQSDPSVPLYKNSFHVDIEKLKAANGMVQCFAMFIDTAEEKRAGRTPYQRCSDMIQCYQQELDRNRDHLRPALTYQDILEHEQQGYISALLTIEEGAALEGSLENLAHFHSLGVRLMTLTWNYPNEIGFPNAVPSLQQKGLTPFGHSVVEEMNRLGMIVDVSHLSDQGFKDVMEISKKPVVASHSNARALCPHPRNLTDEMIRLLANRGGVMGLNFFSKFLGESPISGIEDMVRHILHIIKVGGSEVIALGSDFDGIECSLEIENISQIHKLMDALAHHGLSSTQIEKICYGNALALFKEVLPTR